MTDCQNYVSECSSVNIKETIRREIGATGAVAVGFAEASALDEQVMEEYKAWLAEGNHAGMDYLVRHAELKVHPRHVLEDAATVISIAYSYAPSQRRDSHLPIIASYAYGEDYHDVLRHRLNPVVESLRQRFGGSWRICIDSAPLAERYWAMKCGIGRRGLNGSIIVDGYGSYIFLVEVLTSHSMASDVASDRFCRRCGACVKACPQGALKPDGKIDCRRCLNYLTIEHRGDWAGEYLEAMQTPAGRQTLFGCEVCQLVCPHNCGIASTTIEEFYPRKGIIPVGNDSENTLTGIDYGDGIDSGMSKYAGIDKNVGRPHTSIGEDELLNRKERLLAMTQGDFSSLFRGSPMKRLKLDGLLRNASNLS